MPCKIHLDIEPLMVVVALKLIIYHLCSAEGFALRNTEGPPGISFGE